MNKKAVMSVVLFLFLAVSCSPERQVIQSLQPTPTLVPTLPPTLTLTPTSIGISTSTVLPTQSVSIPKGALLLYTSSQSIQVIPAIGGVPISVVENNTLHYYFSPSWSPSGDSITFAEVGSGISTRINIIHSDGSQLIRLRNNTMYDPAWSPDGEHIAYTSDNKLYLSSVDGSDLHLLVDSINSFFPAWSPDGKQLALLGGLSENSIYGPYKLYLINSDGTGYHAITDAVAGMTRLSWSPDGKKIAFRSYEGCGDINIIDLASSMISNLTNNSKVVNLDPAWSPDGNFIAFSRASFRPCSQARVLSYQGDSLYIIQVNGQGITQIENARGFQPAWWPTMILRPNWEYEVTKTGNNLNVGESPSTSAKSLVKLQEGTIVKILDGPVDGDGLRWWHIAASDNIVGWCAYIDGWFMFHDSGTTKP